MPAIHRLLPLLLVCAAAQLHAGPDRNMKFSEAQRNQLRDAVESHRAAKREEVQRDEAAAGRRLTASERAELREQLRRQWVASSSAAPASVELQPVERIAPTPVAEVAPSRTLVPAARSQRP